MLRAVCKGVVSTNISRVLLTEVALEKSSLKVENGSRNAGRDRRRSSCSPEFFMEGKMAIRSITVGEA